MEPQDNVTSLQDWRKHVEIHRQTLLYFMPYQGQLFWGSYGQYARSAYGPFYRRIPMVAGRVYSIDRPDLRLDFMLVRVNPHMDATRSMFYLLRRTTLKEHTRELPKLFTGLEKECMPGHIRDIGSLFGGIQLQILQGNMEYLSLPDKLNQLSRHHEDFMCRWGWFRKRLNASKSRGGELWIA